MKFADDRPLDLADEQAAINEHNKLLEEQAKPLREKLAELPEAEKA
jgi:hypothetical protein